MALLASDNFQPVATRTLDVAPAHPMRSVMVTVFTLKITIAAVLLACVCMAPQISAESHYQVSN